MSEDEQHSEQQNGSAETRRGLVAPRQPYHTHSRPMSVEHVRASLPVLRWGLFVISILGIALISAGVSLVAIGATGNTKMVLFGNSFESQNVGIAAIFCGVVFAVLGIRRIFLALERLASLPDR